jgi:hypothetical protein
MEMRLLPQSNQSNLLKCLNIRRGQQNSVKFWAWIVDDALLVNLVQLREK